MVLSHNEAARASQRWLSEKLKGLDDHGVRKMAVIMGISTLSVRKICRGAWAEIPGPDLGMSQRFIETLLEDQAEVLGA